MDTHLKNKKQAEIFRKLINEYTDDQFDCFYVCDKAFRDQVDAFDQPEGENLVNSARLVNLHIELQKLTPDMKSAENMRSCVDQEKPVPASSLRTPCGHGIFSDFLFIAK